MTIRRWGSAALLGALLISTVSCSSHDGSGDASTTDGRNTSSVAASTSAGSAPMSSDVTSTDVTSTDVTSTDVTSTDVTATTGPAGTTIASPATSTIVGASTVPATTPPAPATSVPGAPAVTTTVPPPAAALVLRVNGLGNVAFGAEPEAVISYVNSVIGPPDADSGWIDPLSLGSCPGTEVRTVTYGDLDLYFGDQSRVAIGRRHFFAYSLGPATDTIGTKDPVVVPAGMATTARIGVGSTVADLRSAYPGLQINPGDQLSPPSFEVSAGLGGLLSGVDDAAVVTSLQGGFGCGE